MQMSKKRHLLDEEEVPPSKQSRKDSVEDTDDWHSDCKAYFRFDYMFASLCVSTGFCAPPPPAFIRHKIAGEDMTKLTI